MIDHIRDNHDLRTVARAIAVEVLSEVRADPGGALDPLDSYDAARDCLEEAVEASPHALYTSRAVALCTNCNTSAGEELLEDLYGEGELFAGCASFAAVCTRLAYACLLYEAGLELDALLAAQADGLASEA